MPKFIQVHVRITIVFCVKSMYCIFIKDIRAKKNVKDDGRKATTVLKKFRGLASPRSLKWQRGVRKSQ